MTDRTGRPKPRIQPKMNTDTRRHAEKSSYTRKSKYREDLADDEDSTVIDESEDDGVLSDYTDVTELPEPDAPAPARKRKGRR
jgi:DNA polymerase II large subunit